MRGFRFLLILAALAFSGAVHPAAAAAIVWRVENPFRFFTDPSDSEIHRATYRSLGPQEKLSPVLSAEQALQSRHEDGWAATMFRKTCWNWTTNRFSCPAYDDYMNPTSHTVIADVSGIDEAANLTCTWLTAPKGGGDVRGKAVTQPCNDSFVIDVPYPGSTALSVEIGGRDVAQTEVKVRDLLVVGMGDSFASGEGNPDIAVRFSRDRAADYASPGSVGDLSGYPARIGDWKIVGDKTFIGENARWLDQACHRSLYSQQLRVALQLGVEDPHRSVTYVGLACSGGEVVDGLFLRYKGNEWVPNPPLLSQISAAAEAQCGKRNSEAHDLPEAYHINGKIPELKGGLVLRKCAKDYARKIDLVLLSVGGNDIGFSRLLANAVLSDQSTLKKLGGWIGEVHGQAQASAQLTRLDARYKSLNRAIHNLLYIPWDESDRIILTGYPGLALAGDGSETCKDGRAGMEVVSDFRISEQKFREGAWVADKLHRAMRESSEAYGWTFVETHRRQFINRGICSGSTQDGASSADELRMPRKINGVWQPFNPADFQPYASRQRWFRTPNDAFMTGNFHVAASLLQKVMKFDTFAWFQLLLASTYSGAFHPTAEGHAAIADAVADKARAVLQKHGQGSEAQAEVTEPAAAPAVDEPTAHLPELPADLAIGGAANDPVADPSGAAANAPPGAPVSPPAAVQDSSVPPMTPESSALPPVLPSPENEPIDAPGTGTSVGSDSGSTYSAPSQN